MRVHRTFRVAPAVVLVALVSGLTACATSDYRSRRYGRGHENPYEAMRAAAYDLDQQAHEAASRASAMDRRGRRDDDVIERMNHFARRTADFRVKVDHRGRHDRDDIADDLRHLDSDARKVTEEMRESRVADRTWEDWDAVLDSLRTLDRAATDYTTDRYYRDRDRR